MTWVLIIVVLLLGCTTQHDIPTTTSGQKMYHDIGEAFEFNGAESGLPFEVTVDNIWMEDYDEHEDYISEHIFKPTDDKKLLFISYRVTNNGEKTYEFKDDKFYPNNDILPNFLNPNSMISDIDITYPENGVIDTMDDITNLTLEPRETIDITGTVITDESAKYDGAFLWDYDADIPQVVFTRAQHNRKDQVGVYDLGHPVYIEDKDGLEYNVVFNEIRHLRSDQDGEHIEREFESSAFLILDMTIENNGEEDIGISWAFPGFSSNVHHAFERKYFIKKGEAKPVEQTTIIDDHSSESLIKPGETIEGTLYYEVKNMRRHEVMTMDANVYYTYKGFKDYPYYKQWINYNLD